MCMCVENYIGVGKTEALLLSCYRYFCIAYVRFELDKTHHHILHSGNKEIIPWFSLDVNSKNKCLCCVTDHHGWSLGHAAVRLVFELQLVRCWFHSSINEFHEWMSGFVHSVCDHPTISHGIIAKFRNNRTPCYSVEHRRKPRTILLWYPSPSLTNLRVLSKAVVKVLLDAWSVWYRSLWVTFLFQPVFRNWYIHDHVRLFCVTYIHSHIHTYIHTYIHIYIHIYTQTHTYIVALRSCHIPLMYKQVLVFTS